MIMTAQWLIVSVERKERKKANEEEHKSTHLLEIWEEGKETIQQSTLYLSHYTYTTTLYLSIHNTINAIHIILISLYYIFDWFHLQILLQFLVYTQFL